MDRYKFLGVIVMATKSILKNITIKKEKSCRSLVHALECASQKSAKEVSAPAAHIATVDEIRKMFHIK